MKELFRTMNNYLIVAASSVYWAMDDKPHLFEGVQNKVFSIPGLALNHANKEKNLEVLLRTHKIPTKSNKIILWHDAVNNSLSSKKNPALTPSQFFQKLRLLIQYNVVGFTYLPRRGAHDLSDALSFCPAGITFIKINAVLTQRYKKLLEPANDLHLNSILEAHMVLRVVFCESLYVLSQKRAVNRKRNLENRVSGFDIYHFFLSFTIVFLDIGRRIFNCFEWPNKRMDR